MLPMVSALFFRSGQELEHHSKYHSLFSNVCLATQLVLKFNFFYLGAAFLLPFHAVPPSITFKMILFVPQLQISSETLSHSVTMELTAQ